MTSENYQQTFFDAMGLEKSTSSRADSHAKTSASQVDRTEWEKGHDLVYGQKSPVWLANYDRATSSWRTSQTCLVALANSEADGLAEFSETWPASGMMRNGRTYRRQPWALPIAESASGLLPTPSKSVASPRKAGFWTGRYFIKPNGQKAQTRLEDVLGGRPNPEFLEWLMGFPISWTDVRPAETP